MHVNHGIRGAEAGRDERFVRDFCAVRGLRLTVFQRDVPRLAAERREGLEECARRVRHACFAETAAGESDTIATAHNADDNAETLLLNLARGMARAAPAASRGGAISCADRCSAYRARRWSSCVKCFT